MSDPRLGTVLHDRYRIVELLGTGAMGAVYRGERVGLGRAVAIKFLREGIAGDAELRRRFEVEARAMSRVAHPNCVAITDFGVDGETPYLVMDFVAGRSLRDIVVEDGRFEPPRAVALVRQVLAGLAHAHAQGIVHRDVKPENVLVAAVEGHGEHARILDFGLAKLRDDATVTSGMALGTPGYMAPEQWLGHPTDARVDVYAIGVLLHELIAGRKPFVADNPLDVMRMHKDAPPPPLRQAAGAVEVSPELEGVVLRALAKSRDERYSNAAVLLAALDEVPEARAGGTRAAATATAVKAAAPARRSRGVLITAAVVGGVALVLVIGLAAESGGGGGGDAAAKATQLDAGAPPAMEFAPEAAGTAEEPPDVARLRARARQGGMTGAIRALEQMRARQPERAEVHYALGNLMCDALWWQDAMEAYRMALALGPQYRADARLIRDLVRALGNDRAHGQAAELLVTRVGEAAAPELERALRGDNARMRARAEKVRARIAASALE